MRVAEAWKLGHANKDNGLLLLVAVKDRKLRIEVGYGLEGVIPDVLAAQRDPRGHGARLSQQRCGGRYHRGFEPADGRGPGREGDASQPSDEDGTRS